MTIPALLVWAGLPLLRGYALITAEIWLCRFLVAYASAKYMQSRVFPDWKDARQNALLFAFFYQFYPYMLEDVIYRSALGEAGATVAIPLILAATAVLLFAEHVSLWDSVWLAVGMSILICSHTLSTVMICGLLVIVCLVYVRRVFKEKRWLNWLAAALMTVVFSGYWSLAFVEQLLQSYVTVNDISGGCSLAATRLRLAGIICPTSIYSIYYKSQTGRPLTFSSYWPNLEIYFLILAVILCIWNKEKLKKSLPARLVLYGCILFVFMCSKTLLTIADKVSFIRVMQFPWRLLTMVSVFLAIAFTYFYRKEKRKWIKNGILAAFLLSTVVISALPVKWMTSEALWGLEDLLEEGVENTADSLYLPQGAENVNPQERGELIICSNQDVLFDWSRDGGSTHIVFQSGQTDAKQVYFELPLYYYYGYSAILKSDDAPDRELTVTKSENGLVKVCMDGNTQGTIDVSYTGTRLQHVATRISVLGWIGLLGAVIARGILKRKMKE